MSLPIRSHVLEVGRALGILCNVKLEEKVGPTTNSGEKPETDLEDGYAKAIAEMLLGMWRLAAAAGVHIQVCIEQKMVLNRAKYRPDDCLGDVTTKYTAYTQTTGITASNQVISMDNNVQDLDGFIGGLDGLARDAVEFAVERDWIKFDTRCNLIMSLSAEFGELCTALQFHDDTLVLLAPQLNKVGQEIADICIYALRLAERVGRLGEVKRYMALLGLRSKDIDE